MAEQSKEQADLFAFGKQFWDTWTGFAQQVMGGQTPAWGAPADVFARVMPESMADASHAAESMADQGRQFLEFLQAAAAQMGAGEPLDAARVASMWKDGLAGGNPLLDALRAVNSEGARGLEQAGRDLIELLAPMRRSIEAQFDSPALGYTRERQEHWQALQRAAADHAQAQSAYNTLLLRASQRGMEYFENRLVERSEPGRQIDSPRALYDLWVDAAEDAYAEVAMSPEFRHAYGELVNTQMRLRQRVQAEAEHQAAQLGMPTRSELDGTHRKLQQLAREMRELRAALARSSAASPGMAAKPARAAAASTSTQPAAPAARRKPSTSAARPAAKSAATSAAKSAGAKTGRAPARKAKPPVQKSSAPKTARRRAG